MRDVFFLTCGRFRVPLSAVAPRRRLFSSPPPLRGGWWSLPRATTLSNTIAVAVRDSGDVVLVDCGWSRDTCADPARAIGKLHATTLGVRTAAGDAIADQLARVGIEASRVKTIVATHLHLDHVGGAADFPNAEVVCTLRELRAYTGFPAAAGYRAADLARAGRVRPLTLDEAPTYGFASSKDLFGDGEVVMLDAKGHTKGTAAVALRTKDGCFVHVGDAVYQSWEYGIAPRGPCLTAKFTAWSRSETEATYARIRACEADPRRPTIVPSHDWDVFERLPQGPKDALTPKDAPTPMDAPTPTRPQSGGARL